MSPSRKNARLKPMPMAFIAWAALLAAAGAAEAKTWTVDLTDQPPYMTPLSMKVKVGDTLVFKNHGPEMVHSITDDTLTVHSGDIVVGKDWSYTFKRAGEYPYVCYRHHFMRGLVVVANPDGTTTAPPAFAYQTAIREFVVPTLKAVPRMIIASRKDDSMWFTEGGGDFYGFEGIPANNKLGQIFDGGRIVEYATPTPGSDGSTVAVDSLVMDRDGNVWFTERLTSKIGRLTPDGRITEYPLPTGKSQPLGIDEGADGRLWIAERSGNRLAVIDRAGHITEHQLPGENSEPRTVYVDRKQRVWYTARAANEIGYFEEARKRFVRLQLPTANARPTGIAELSDGTIYFVEMVGNKIGKVVGNQIVEYALPTKFAAPFKIVADKKDQLWFTEVFGNAIGRLNPRTGEITEYRLPTADSRPGGITVDRRGRIWFTEQTGNKIGMIDPSELDRVAAVASSATAGMAREVEARGQGERTGEWPPAAPGGRPPAAGGTATPSGPAPAPHPGAHPHETPAPARTGAGPRAQEAGGARPRASTAPRSDGAGGLILLASAALLSPVAPAVPPARAVLDFALPVPGSGPGADLVEDGQRLWFNEIYGNRVGYFDRVTRTFKEFELPTPFSMPTGLALGPGDRVWVVQFRGNALAELALKTGKISEHPLPTDASLPASVTVAQDGEVWLTELGNNAIARFDPKTGRFDEVPMPRPGSSPLHIVWDGQQGLWISASEEAGNYVTRFDLRRRQFAVFDLPRPAASPTGLLVGRDEVWVAEGGAATVARLDPRSGRWDEYRIPAADAEPVRLARDRRGRIWTTDGGGLGGVGGNRLAVLDVPSRRFELVPMRVDGAKPRAILATSDGNIWFTQQNANLLSMLKVGTP